jgi:CubicO group peptidase (beta-lactamase class C family)
MANEMGISRSPTRLERMQWMLHQPLPHTPGGAFYYSNFGYMVLGYIIDTAAGTVPAGGGYATFIHDRVLTMRDWVPQSEFRHGKTLEIDRATREARYLTPNTGQNVFDYSPPISVVSTAYGGEFDLEALLGAGSVVASAPAMLNFASRFRLWYPNAGVPYSGNGDWLIHDGGLAGTSARFVSRGDGVVVFMVFNKDNVVGGAYDQIAPILDAGPGADFTWPSTTSDGHWTTMPEGNPATGYGGYHSPWQGFGSTLDKSHHGSRLRLKPGNSNWTGRISKRVRLDAPEGTVRIGVNP